MIRRVVHAAGLSLALVAPLAAAPLDGARVQALIAEALARAGQDGQAAVSAHRSFPDCAASPTVIPQNGGWQVIALTCEDEPGWSRMIRIDGGRAAPRRPGGPATQDLTRALVLRDSLPRGTVLTRDHLEAADIPATGQGDLVIDADTALGRSLKVNLGAGQALLGRHLDHDWAVDEGARVTIAGASGSIRIETAGVALEPGQLGQDIRVRNARSGREIAVTVTGPNKVTVRPNMR